ncbi:hypothetical protein MA9V2_225 [Chryseobacterium phage MA9V-2]|nr:hypothetical protein MA9V2_225 [Chryseobacterium phage MA9V-2]
MNLLIGIFGFRIEITNCEYENFSNEQRQIDNEL